MKRKQLNLDSNHHLMECVRIIERDKKILNYKLNSLIENYGEVELHKKMSFYYVINGIRIYWFKSLEKAARFYRLKVFWYKYKETKVT